METGTVHGGSQSLPYSYGQDGAAVSEATLPINAQDWSKYGIKSLSLFFYGSADNTGGQLYVKINNGTPHNYQGGATDIQTAQWFPFTVDLAGVTIVNSLTIGVSGGSGIFYVDDICLYAQDSELVTPAAPGDDDPNLVAHYEFEGNPDDSKGNYPGTAVGDPVYAPGKYGQALSLDGVDDHIENVFDPNVVWPACSVSLWAKTDVFGQTINTGLFNNNSDGADFQIAVNGADGYEYRGANAGQMGPVSSDWVHLTVSCDGTQTQLYYNGVYVRTVDEARLDFGQIAVGANRVTSLRFAGTIDDVRVYDRALSTAEAAALAGRTAPLYKSF